MFKLTKQPAFIKKVNPKTESDSEDKKLTFEVFIKCSQTNKSLEMLDKSLLSFLFIKGDPGDADLADQGVDEDHLPVQRYKEIPSVPWNYHGAGYRVVFDSGLGDNEIYFIGAQVDQFKIKPINGGVVDYEFRIKLYPNENESGPLVNLVEKEVTLTLEPPSAEKLAQMEIDAAA